MKISPFFLGCLMLLTAGLFVACEPGSGGETPQQEVNVYSHRHYDTDKELFKRFEDSTGIKVNVVKASADELIQKLEQEGENSIADVLVTVDAGRLFRAKDKGLLQAVSSEVLNQQVPASLRDPEGQWYSVTQRSRVIVYAKDRVDPAELSSYEDLADPKWKGKVLVRSSSNIYNQSLMASLIHHLGEEAALNWAKAVVGNMARDPKGNDRDQVKAIAAGLGDVALVNTYYIGRLLTSDNEAEKQAGEAIGVFYPNQADRGAHMNSSGVGVTAHAPNKENAIRLIEFMTGPEAQDLYASSNFEFPVNPGVAASEMLQSWGEFQPDSLNLDVLGRLNNAAVKTFDQAGWQ
ncbi:MAG: Fe(3+) ABC transporter substrate-binding protein [Bacteroidota bacterium]